MPKILEDLKDNLVAKGMPRSQSYAIATSALQKQGKLKQGTNKLAHARVRVKKKPRSK